MDLFIGRKKTNNQLMAVVSGKEYLFGKPGEVPNTVSENHCHIRINTENEMRIINLKDGKNYTWVDGVPVTEAGITEDSMIALGGNEWQLDLKMILAFFRKNGMLKSTEKPYEISHLEAVYREYHDENMQIKIKQGQFGAIRSITGILTPFAILGGVFLGSNGSFLTIGIYAVLILSGIFFVIHQWKTSKSLPIRLEELQKDFQARYVCPNEECKRSFVGMPYDELKKMKTCPHCKKPWVSDGTGIVTKADKQNEAMGVK